MKHTENIAVIDIGSNSLRLLIGNISKDKLNKLCSQRVVTRLGETVKGFLNKESVESSINTLKKFKKLCEKFDVSCIIAVGTSALREAKNSDYFYKLVKEHTGIKIKVISGEEEAYYTLCGVMNKELEKENSCFIVDIGGGSTEWIYWKDQKIKVGSLSIGALKIKGSFLNEDTLSQEAVFKANKLIEEKVKATFIQLKIDKFIATGGTASTLAMINFGLHDYSPEKTHMSEISVNKLKLILKNLQSLPLQKRKQITGMSSDRADIICEGLIILEAIMNYLNIEKVIISENGILEGIMKNYKKFCYNNPL